MSKCLRNRTKIAAIGRRIGGSIRRCRAILGQCRRRPSRSWNNACPCSNVRGGRHWLAIVDSAVTAGNRLRSRHVRKRSQGRASRRNLNNWRGAIGSKSTCDRKRRLTGCTSDCRTGEWRPSILQVRRTVTTVGIIRPRRDKERNTLSLILIGRTRLEARNGRSRVGIKACYRTIVRRRRSIILTRISTRR